MKLLLDSHVLLWAYLEPEKLSRRSSDVIRDPGNELFVSAITGFEIATKHRIGKLPDAESLLLSYAENLARLGARQLDVGGRHAVAAGRLDWLHRDPFDRILAAQSILEGIPLVTSDAAFASLSGLHTIWD